MSARTTALWVCGALWLLGAVPARARIDPFYLELEREARTALDRGDAAAAAKLFRVACFGLLDEPARLAACTVQLMKAQVAVRDAEGFRASFLRLATVEERFQGLTLSGVSPEEKRELARLAAARLSPEIIAQIPELAAMIAAERESEAARSAESNARPRERKNRGKAVPAPVPAPAADAVSPTPTPEIALDAMAPAPVPDVEAARSEAETPQGALAQSEHLEPIAAPAPGSDAAPIPEPSADRERLDSARQRIAGRPDRAVVEAELDAVRAISDRSPGDVAAARLAGDLAYLLGLWSECADYYQRAGDPGPELPLSRFYMAVCLFETGQAESAARLIAPSADRLKRSPFVDSYLSRILGSPQAP